MTAEGAIERFVQFVLHPHMLPENVGGSRDPEFLAMTLDSRRHLGSGRIQPAQEGSSMSLPTIAEALAKVGGALSYDEGTTELDKTIKRLFSRSALTISLFLERNSITSTAVTLAFSNSMDVFGGSVHCEDGTLIVLNLGTIIKYKRLYDEALANNELLRNVGNVSDELPRRDTSVWIDDYLDREEELSTGGTWRKPINEDRRIFADHLLQATIDYYIFHELLHYTHGHTELRSMRRLEGAPLTNANLQAFEYDADMTAVQNTLRRTAILDHRNQEAMVLKDRPSKFAQEQAIVHTAYTLATVARRGFPDIPPDDSDKNIDALISERSHPLGWVRIEYFYRAIVQHIKRWCPDVSREKADFLFREGVGSAEKMHQFLSRDKIFKLSSYLDEEFAKQYMDRLAEEWKIIEPSLVPYLKAGFLFRPEDYQGKPIDPASLSKRARRRAAGKARRSPRQ